MVPSTTRRKRYVWANPPSNKQERVLLAKVDWFILSYCCLMVRASILKSHLVSLIIIAF